MQYWILIAVAFPALLISFLLKIFFFWLITSENSWCRSQEKTNGLHSEAGDQMYEEDTISPMSVCHRDHILPGSIPESSEEQVEMPTSVDTFSRSTEKCTRNELVVKNEPVDMLVSAELHKGPNPAETTEGPGYTPEIKTETSPTTSSHGVDIAQASKPDGKEELRGKRRSGLKLAILSNDVTELESAIEWAKFDGFQAELRDEIYQATRTIRQLSDLVRIKKAVRDLRQSVVSELRSYSKPPPAVHTVMLCTYLLLGVKEEKQLRQWQHIQALLTQRGKDSLKQLIMHFDPREVVPEVAKRISELLSGYDLKSICDVSDGAAVFYVWVTEIIKEITFASSVRNRRE